MAISPPATRGQWGSRMAFILAAAGSAIGLGNIWRFPYSAGVSGGGAFVLVYLIFVFAIGIPVLLTELSIGRRTERNPVGAFRELAPKSWWPALGGLGVLTGFGILAFYSVIAGWTLGYLYHAIIGSFSGGITADESGTLFTGLIGNPGLAILLTGLFMILTIAVVRGGIGGGIERVTRILMPVLFVILVLLALRAITLPGGMEGVAFLLKPDFSKLNAGVMLNALGQALFSLSVGMGAMITYGSYFPKTENLYSAGVYVALFDTVIAILAGLIVFPALFSAGVDPARGPSLVFVVLPTIFGSLPGGTLIAIAFFALLAIAALTSTISLLEVVVSYFVDERGWTREKASWLIGGLCFLFAIPSALSQGANGFLSSFLGPGLDFLSVQNIVFGNYSLSIGAILICVFAGWKWGIKNVIDSLEEGGFSLPGAPVFGFLVRVLCPVAVVLVLIFLIVTGNYL